MLVAISGPRPDGSRWPGVGGEIEVSQAEGEHMVTGQLAVPVVDDAAETAVPSTVGVEARQALTRTRRK